MRASLRDYGVYFWQLLAGIRTEGETKLAKERQKDVSSLLDFTQPLRVLDLANGRLRPQYTIMKAAGVRVYGIDLVNGRKRDWRDFAYSGARCLFRWKMGFRERADSGTLTCGDVSTLPFPNGCFDVITSIAAFEHFLAVAKVIAEMHRVLRPAGIAWVTIHPFTSPSGGHNVSLAEVPLKTIPRGTEPWDHLRKRRLPFSVPLNELRLEQYLAAFGRHFDILKSYCAMREGEEFLTPEIAAELSGYTRDELTCGAYVIVARKQRSTSEPQC